MCEYTDDGAYRYGLDMPHVTSVEGLLRRRVAGSTGTQSEGGSSRPDSSAASASCLVACTAPTACSGGPYTV